MTLKLIHEILKLQCVFTQLQQHEWKDTDFDIWDFVERMLIRGQSWHVADLRLHTGWSSGVHSLV